MVFRLRVRARVRFRVSSNAVFASSARSASRAHRLDTVGLGLTGPSRDCPPALDDDPGAPCAPLGDLYVSDIEDPSSLRPPPVGATSAARERCRKEVSGTFHWLSAPSASPGAVRTHGPTLRAFAPKVSTKLSLCVLPAESEGVFDAFFAAALLLGPKFPSSGAGQATVS